MKRVEVFWIDIAGYPGWQIGRDLREIVPAECRTMGYLLENSRKYVKLAGSKNMTDADYGDVMVIPKSNVKKIKWIR